MCFTGFCIKFYEYYIVKKIKRKKTPKPAGVDTDWCLFTLEYMNVYACVSLSIRAQRL